MARHLPTDEIVDLYVNQKMKIYQLATRYNCSEFAIKKRLIEKGVFVRKQFKIVNISPQQRELLLDIFDISNGHFNKVRTSYGVDVYKLLDLVTTENAPYVVREDFYKLFNSEDIADLWWERFCDWWFEKYDNNNKND